LVENFIREDPFKEIRVTLKLLIELNNNKKRNILVITNSLGGGSRSYLNNLKRALSNEFRFVELRYDNRVDTWFLEDLKLNREIEDSKYFNKLLNILNIHCIFINQLVSHPDPLRILQTIKSSKKPYIYVFHDYFAVCPNWNLIAPNGWFCGLNKSLEFCRSCLTDNRYADYRLLYDKVFDIKSWRASWKDFLEKAKAVVFFSEDSEKIVKKVYNLHNTVVIEHYTEPLRRVNIKEDSILTVGTIGAIGYSKGWEIIKMLSERFRTKPIRFVIAGITAEINSKFSRGNLIVTGQFERSDLPKIMEEYNVDVVLIPSIWPETYSYTTTEAIMMGLPVIVFDLGAQAERVKKLSAGFVVNSFSDLVDLIEKLLRDKSTLERIKKKMMLNVMDLERWKRRYITLLY